MRSRRQRPDWIAVEALRAPLPPQWKRLPDSTFEHLVTHEHATEHPLLHVFEQTVEHERRRKRSRRPFGDLERFMLFALAPADGSPDEANFAFYNFATRQYLSGRKLPAEAIAEQMAKRPPPPPPKKRAARSTASTRQQQTAKFVGQCPANVDANETDSAAGDTASTSASATTSVLQRHVVKKNKF